MLAVLYSDTFEEHVKIFEGVFVRIEALIIDKVKNAKEEGFCGKVDKKCPSRNV